MSDPRTVLQLVAFAEGLKNVLRHSYTTGGRRESVAEHAWMLCLMALAIFDELGIEVDRLRVLKMLIVHDLPEIITGDIPAFDKETIAEQAAAAEAAALERIRELGPTGPEIVALCEEFEARQTPEALLASALDKAEALIQHNLADIATWDENDIAYQTNPHHPRSTYFAVDPFMQALKLEIDRDTLAKLSAAGKLNDAHPDFAASVSQRDD